jgi:hypothetical protein
VSSSEPVDARVVFNHHGMALRLQVVDFDIDNDWVLLWHFSEMGEDVFLYDGHGH